MRHKKTIWRKETNPYPLVSEEVLFRAFRNQKSVAAALKPDFRGEPHERDRDRNITYMQFWSQIVNIIVINVYNY
jgi:hypothetical protein